MESLSHQSLTWYNLVRPTQAELQGLQQQYGFHELDIEDCLSEHERPKIDEYDDYIFIVLHIPYLVPEGKRVLKEEVNIFLGSNYVITLHDGNLDVLNTFWRRIADSPEMRKEALGEGTGLFLYELVSRLFDSFFPLIDGINKQLRMLEGILFEEEGEEKVLRLILELKRSIISMRRILLPQRTIVAGLEHKSKKFVPEELDVYFDDVQDAIERQWSMLETVKEVIEALQDSHEAWVRNRTNRTMQVLTVFSMTMLPLTVITGLFGMNVPIPHGSDPWAFLGISFILLGFLVATFVYSLWKRWL
jgi:magnesium transporter